MSSTMFYFLFVPLLVFILLSVNLILAPHNPYMEKKNVFECGFSSFLGQNRTQFSISFFIFALLFLLFDLEILLVYPYLVSAYTNAVYGLVIMLMFLLALALGFAFELGKKALSIDSRQMFSVSANNKHNGTPKVDTSNKDKSLYRVNTNVAPSFKITRSYHSSSTNKAIGILHKHLLFYYREVMLTLFSCLVISLLAYFIFISVLGLTHFISCFMFTFMLLVVFIDNTFCFYVARKSKTSAYTSIKPYSNNGFISKVFFMIEKHLCPHISLVRFFLDLTSLVRYLISIVLSPLSVLISVICSGIRGYILTAFTYTPYYKTFEHFFSEYIVISDEKGFIFAFDSLAIGLSDWLTHNIKKNILNIFFFSLFCLYAVYTGFIPCFFLLWFALVIFFFIAIIHTSKSRALFVNKVLFWLCLAIFAILFFIAFYKMSLYILAAYNILTKGYNNPYNSGNGPTKRPNTEGPEGPGGPGGPGGPDGYNSSYPETNKGKRKRNEESSDVPENLEDIDLTIEKKAGRVQTKKETQDKHIKKKRNSVESPQAKAERLKKGREYYAKYKAAETKKCLESEQADEERYERVLAKNLRYREKKRIRKLEEQQRLAEQEGN